MDREKSLIKNTFVLALGKFLPHFTALVTLPIYTTMLTSAEYGRYDLILVLQYILEIAALVQIHQAAFRFLIDVRGTEKERKYISTTVAFALIPSLLISILPAIIYRDSGVKNSIVIAIYFFVCVQYNVTGQIARGLGKNKEYSIAAVIQAVLNMILVIILLSNLKLGFFGLFMALDLAFILAYGYLAFSCGIIGKIDFKQCDFETLKEMLDYSWPMVPNSLSVWIINACDKFIIRFFLGLEQNGIYAIAQKIPNIFNMAYSTFNLAWQESASATIKDEDSDKYYSNVFAVLFRFLVGCMLLLIASTPILFSILIRGDYDAAYKQMPILYIGIFLASISSFYGSIYIAQKQTRSVGLTSLIGAVINCVINITMIKSFGLYAASTSTAISYFVLIIYRLADIKKRKLANIFYEKRVMLLSAGLLMLSAILCYQRNLLCDAINFVMAIVVAIILNKKMIVAISQTIKNTVFRRR